MECVKVDTHCTGEIDCDDFKAKISRNKDKPAIVNVNIGKFLPPPSHTHERLCALYTSPLHFVDSSAYTWILQAQLSKELWMILI